MIIACNSCGVSDPAEDLPWLKSVIEEIEFTEIGRQFMYVQEARYLGKSVFIIGNCCPYCNVIIPVYDCDGELVCNLGTCNVSLFKNRKLIWSGDPFECTL